MQPRYQDDAGYQDHDDLFPLAEVKVHAFIGELFGFYGPFNRPGWSDTNPLLSWAAKIIVNTYQSRLNGAGRANIEDSSIGARPSL